MNFKKLALVAAAVGLTFTAVAASAADGSFVFKNGKYVYVDATLDSGPFVDKVSFSLSQSFDALAVGADLVQELTDTEITSATIQLYNATTNKKVGTSFTVSTSTLTATESYVSLASGSYYFLVSGTVPEGDDGAYSLKLTLSPPTGTIASVPEPATTALLLAGVGVMGLLSRRRKQK